MQVTIKNLKQEAFTVECPADATVLALKEAVEAAKGAEYWADGLKLIFNGKILTNTGTVAELSLKPDSFIVALPSKTPKPGAAAAATTPAAPAATASPAATSTTEATPAAPTPAPSTAAPSSGPTTALDEPTVARLSDMGFPREMVEAALRAAFGNADRAVEYLMTGIPEGAQGGSGAPQQQQQMAAPPAPAAPIAAPSGGGGGGGGSLSAASPLAPLATNPQFNQLRQLVQQNPALLPALLQQLAQLNPQLVQLINANQEDFRTLLNAPVGGGGGGAPPQGGGGGGHQIQVTPEEGAAIDRLCGLGFDRNIVIQAYFACEKDENAAANFLLMQGDFQ